MKQWAALPEDQLPRPRFRPHGGAHTTLAVGLNPIDRLEPENAPWSSGASVIKLVARQASRICYGRRQPARSLTG